MSACAFCGRDNDAGADFCADCGKSLPGRPVGLKGVERSTAGGSKGSAPRTQVAVQPEPGAATRPTVQTQAAARCPFCAALVSIQLPFCPDCGRRLTAQGSGPCCDRCGAPHGAGARFCATCGAPVGEPSRTVAAATAVLPGPSETMTVVLSLLNETGAITERFERQGPHVTVGREDADLAFPDDAFLSPLHAKLSFEDAGRDRRLVVRDLGSRNGTWVFLEAPHRLEDGDLLLVGSQVIRFRRLGYPGPHAPDADATKRMGSATPSADIASLTQLRADGSGRDVVQLSPGRDIQIGRERGDWVFPYDQSMSALHAMIRSEDADFVVIDARSRNGVAVAARGAVPLSHRSRILVGDKLLLVELPPAAAPDS